MDRFHVEIERSLSGIQWVVEVTDRQTHRWAIGFAFTMRGAHRKARRLARQLERGRDDRPDGPITYTL